MTKQPIEFMVSKEMLRGNLYLADQSKDLAVLFLHGWTGLPNEEAAETVAEKGFSSMTFSLSGHEGSSGKLEEQTREKSLAEIIAAYDFFRLKLPAEVKIGAAGNSYGGYMAALLSAERQLAFVHMRVPANYPDERFSESQMGQGREDPKVWEWRHEALAPNATKALRALHDFEGPVQILEAELDDHVPHQTVQNFVDAVSDKSQLDYRFMKGWPHSMGLDRQRNHDFQQILLKWLNEQV